ncbi:hypothetical protein ANN_07906 [Periplaneta americana]|uniref:Transposase Tc1-like domain-containing protein n=1 Tax=Periplaneta americana TaxID=6978 RepID=A0ABQ8T0K7_PERAM|nr:hypothetical protein ANN_07906 [Periplaneta americana]
MAGLCVGRPEGKRALGRSRRRWEDNIKMDLREDLVSVETESVARRPGIVRQRKTTPVQNRFVGLQALRNRQVTARTLQVDLHQASGVQASDETVENRLREANLRSRRASRVPGVERIHRDRRMQFARNRLEYQLKHWHPLLFQMNPVSLYMVAMVVCESGEDVGSDSILKLSSLLLLTEMDLLWCGQTCLDTKTDLITIRNGSLTIRLYIDEILVPHVITQVRRLIVPYNESYLIERKVVDQLYGNFQDYTRTQGADVDSITAETVRYTCTFLQHEPIPRPKGTERAAGGRASPWLRETPPLRTRLTPRSDRFPGKSNYSLPAPSIGWYSEIRSRLSQQLYSNPVNCPKTGLNLTSVTKKAPLMG